MLSLRRDSPLAARTLRVVSAVALAPPVLAALYLGPPASDLLLALAAGLMAWEWSRVCGGRAVTAAHLASLAGGIGTVLAGAIFGPSVAVWWILAAAMVVAVSAARQPAGGSRPAWLLFGVIYVGLPVMALQWLRGADAEGREIVFWLLAVVWATDIGAYLVGRSVGGARIWPRVSPGKTWSGLAGGVLAASLAGAAASYFLGFGGPARLAGLAAGLAVVAQAGDFFESAVKRHFGVKDMGQSIPGHGGLLDRVDGLVTATLFLAILVALGEIA